jgi:hypothetical protein
MGGPTVPFVHWSILAEIPAALAGTELIHAEVNMLASTMMLTLAARIAVDPNLLVRPRRDP